MKGLGTIPAVHTLVESGRQTDGEGPLLGPLAVLRT